MEGLLVGIGIGATFFFIVTLYEIAAAIKSVAKEMGKRNEIERKKMELQGLEAKRQGVFRGDVDEIVNRSY